MAATLITSVSCTFYTECPTATGSGGANGAGGSNGSGGASATNGIVGSEVPGNWDDATGDLTGRKAGFGSVTYVTWYPGHDVLLAGVTDLGLLTSSDAGATWQSLGTAKDSEPINNRPTVVVFDPADPEAFWESGSYGFGVFNTSNGGYRFANLGDLQKGEGLGIDFTDPRRQTLFASGHEAGNAIYRSSDGGDSWETIKGPSDTNACSFPLVFDSQTVLIGCSGLNGAPDDVFRSEDSGESWSRLGTNMGWETALVASDGSIYWAIYGNRGILRSDDSGVSWDRVNDVLDTVHPIELPDGTIASVADKEVVLSGDRGKTWRRVTPALPFDPVGIAYSEVDRALFAWHYATDAEIPEQSIMSFPFDYEAQ